MKNATPILENDFVKLSPLSLGNYHYLLPIAGQKKLVQYSPSDIETSEALKNYVEQALEKERSFLAMPFIIYDKKNEKYAGSTRFMNIDRKNKVLEIGATWIGREFQGTGLNGQAKLLMINYVFNEMLFEKVEFRIDERNVRSRRAVEKLGAKLEGILRKNVYLLDGFKRNTCCYGILKEEWG
ncbi:GNAT family protein [Arenibacter sp. M-2]|uniref:GNAT family N-acetyltransferase n=1 Tax=unclassified Arenibacter TaxID=2615047 RepID=UPI000D75E455|nr:MULTISPECIES: GNAT family protein [unclassified Arenibacter]MDL5511770.1 GNAT family protein [Arenibacter sp. M-2]PXX29866.1 RimJ/RimL family protein N-acetyltransferase [Arenibacter sp. ARW7G5Y1]|tara:strand:- start:2433 stop:2981 length:549 start_codon:yes stop_codon:yes gene_type:complete